MSAPSRSAFYRGGLWRFAVRPIDKAIRITLILLVQLYQVSLSWLLGGQCRFYPTCSDYAVDALTLKPVWRSLPLVIWRVVRCNPLCKGGHEEVAAEDSDEWTRFEWRKRKRRENW